MIFSSLTFLLAFLPTLLLCYFVIPKNFIRIRKYVLLLFSLLFYAMGEPFYIIIILMCVIITWLLSVKIEEGEYWAFVAALLTNFLPLVLFKYSGFIIDTINTLAYKDFFRSPDFTLPIGISFYTFQMISYIVDLWNEDIERQENIGMLTLYIMSFPQLIAGPIVRYSDIEDALVSNKESWDKIKRGARKFIIGLTKKILIANQVGYIATEIISHPTYSISTGLMWLGVFAFTLQILFDFSGYSDMAIGLGLIFGFEFPENFDKPYHSTSITEFWRRWHITLGSFFRDYVYIPMGGNRVPVLKWLYNMTIVWFLTGLWHGASWNYVIWGIYNGLLLVIEKLMTGRVLKRIPKFFSWLITFFCVMVGWAIFMCDGYSVSKFVSLIGKLFYNGEIQNRVTIGSMGLWGYLPYCIIAFIIASPIETLIKKGMDHVANSENVVIGIVNDIVLIGLFLLCIVFIVGSSYNPFIYFRF